MKANKLENQWFLDSFILEKHFDAVEQGWTDRKAKHRDKVKSVFSHRVDVKSKEELEDDVEQLQAVVLNPHFRFSRYSCIFLLWSLAEINLTAICSAVKDRLSVGNTVDDATGSFTQRVKNYLETHASLPTQLDKFWSDLEFLQSGRNCIVHTHGDVEKTRRQDRLRIEQNVENWTGIRVTDGELLIEKEFLYEALERTSDLFKNLVPFLQKGED